MVACGVRVLLGIALAGFASIASAAAPEPHGERRCGWFVNVTPGNFELVDREGEWTIAEQGGYEAAGLDPLPDMSAKGWVKTNGPHGHGCACMTVTTDRESMRITKLFAATPVPLKQCSSDRHLPKP